MAERKFNALHPGDAGYNEAPLFAEVHGVGDPVDHFSSNSLRFSTTEDAESYAKDLASRWFGMDRWRVAKVVTG